jgi:DNA-directed RNA polymerase subunit RPC12/RpoP
LSEIRTLFRFCPACGRRFHIKLVSKELVGDRKETTEMKQSLISPTGGAGVASYSRSYIVLEENVPVTIDVKDFQYTYKCKHCGHVWTEMKEEESRVGK